MTAADIFHAHLKICDQCMSHPFDLCIVGRKLMADFQGENTGQGAHMVTLDEDEAEAYTEATGHTLFGIPVVRVKPIDINRLYSRQCDEGQLGLPCKGHTALVALNTIAVGLCVGTTMTDALNGGIVQQRRFMSPKEARAFFKHICKRMEEVGYTFMWQGGTLCDDQNGSVL